MPDNSTVAAFIRAARRQIGDDYQWGAEGPSGFDCSGLVWFALNRAGVDIPRTTAAGFQSQLDSVNKANLKPGDLVYFDYGRLGPGTADHIGIYIGNGKMIAASSSADQVQIQSVDWAHYIGGGRVDQLGRKGSTENWVGGSGTGGGGGGGGGGSATGFDVGGPTVKKGELAGILRGFGLNPGMFDDVIHQAISHQWSPYEFQAALYDSDAFHEMFPGIFNKDGSLKMTPAEWNALAFGEGGYQDISSNFGIKLNRDKIGALVENNVSPDEWAFRGYVLQQAKSSDVYRDAFNKVLQASGQKPLDKGEWFNYIAGHSDARIENLYEAASLASAEGLDINAKGALAAAHDIGQPGEQIDVKQLVQQVRQVADFVSPELRQAGITDADLAVLESGNDPKGIRSQLEQIVKNRQALVGGRITAGLGSGGGGLFPAQREGQ